VTPEEECIVSLYQKGYSLRQVGDRTGVSSMTVRRTLILVGIVPRKQSTTGHLITEHECRQCNRVLPVDAFIKNSRNSSGRDWICRPCRTVYQTASFSRLRKYHLPLDDFYVLSAYQGHRCAICGASPKDPDYPSRWRALYIDHDHVTGFARGLLCGRCNSLLGMACDDPEILQSAVGYLSENPAEKCLCLVTANKL
jgi:hypothetical protein